MKRTAQTITIILCNLSAVVMFLAAVGCAARNEETGDGQTQQGDSKPAAMELSSSGFLFGMPIPKKYTGEGENVSPPLSWTDPPAGTRSLVLICDDPDAPSGTWTHWILYDIPAAARSLPEGLPKTDTVLRTAKQGRNGSGGLGYTGPMPPPGKVHNYTFTLYALDQPTQLPGRVMKTHVMHAIEGHVVAKAELVGTYKR